MDDRRAKVEETPHDKDRGFVKVTVNGTQTECPQGLSVAELIYHLGLPAERVAVERNREIVKRDKRDSILIEPGDVFEIVTFVGGG